MTTRVPFAERGGAIRGCLDLVSGRFPRFVFGGGLDNRLLLPVFHFHEVTRNELEPKLRYLAENGYRTAVCDDIAAYVRGDRHFDTPHVALCFDDAWASLWTVAAPLLRQYGLTAITYAIPERIAEASASRGTLDTSVSVHEGPPFVTWPELRALHDSGVVDVQCHTDSHSMIFTSSGVSGFVTPGYASTPLLNRPRLARSPALRFLQPEELGAPLYTARSRMSDGPRVVVPIDLHERCVDYVARAGGSTFFTRPDWRSELGHLAESATPGAVENDVEHQRAIEAELDRGRAVLNERLRTNTVNHVCLPWGVSGRRSSTALVRLGYRSAFANRLRGLNAVRPGDDPHWLKRLPNRYIERLPGRARRIWL
jgi:hypothetical protein